MAATIDRPSAIGQSSIQFAPLTDDVIARQTDAGSFSRGKTYFRGKRIFNAVRRGSLLRARCRGSSGGPYLVEATLAPGDKPKSRNPLAYHCNCPRGGFCKHVVALLLTWTDRPEAFEVRPPVADLLANKSREELIALVEVIVSSHPELDTLIELPPPAAIAVVTGPVDEAALRRLVDSAFPDPEDASYRDWHRGYDYDDYAYDDTTFASSDLERVVGYADAYIEHGDWRNAALVSAVLAERLPSDIELYEDDAGTLATLLGRTDANLAACLEAQEQLPAAERLTDDERARSIDAILEIWEAALEAGGLDFSDGGPEAIGQLATAAETARVRERLRVMMRPASGETQHHQWRNRAVIAFLSLLQGQGGLTDEDLLAEYRHAEIWDAAAALLLELGRVDEAVALASRKLTNSTALMAFAEHLLAGGDASRVQRAIALVDDRLWEREGQNVHDDQRLREWLEQRALEHGAPEKALELARRRFQVSPCKATYDAVKTAALHPGQPDAPWPELRPKLIATLDKSNGLYALIDIYLEEGEVAAALQALRKSLEPSKRGRPAWGDAFYASRESYSARVADAARADFPEEAAAIYQRLAEDRIAGRSRPAYQAAAAYLTRARNILEGIGRQEEWQAFIADLRARYKSLRALREELDALGLN